MLPSLREKDRPYPKSDKVRETYSLDSFRGFPHFWQRGAWLAGVPLVLCLLWLGVECLRRNWRVFQAGPVSSDHHPASAARHADFNDDCTLCHTQPFQTWKRL